MTTPADETVHACPPVGSGLTSCCRRNVFELPRTDRITADLREVTCHPAGWPTAGARIQARWDHGHDQLTDGCALCQAEYAEARDWVQANPEEPDHA